jgi:hypothetical protein
MTVLALFVLVAALQAQSPEARPPAPAGSVEIGARGCLRGRVFTATPRTEKDGATSIGPDVTGRNFRLSGSRAVMDQVSWYNGSLVEVKGLVREAELNRPVPGARPGTSVGNPPRVDPTRKTVRTTPTGGLPIMDLGSVRLVSNTCPIQQ